MPVEHPDYGFWLRRRDPKRTHYMFRSVPIARINANAAFLSTMAGVIDNGVTYVALLLYDHQCLDTIGALVPPGVSVNFSDNIEGAADGKPITMQLSRPISLGVRVHLEERVGKGNIVPFWVDSVQAPEKPKPDAPHFHRLDIPPANGTEAPGNADAGARPDYGFHLVKAGFTRDQTICFLDVLVSAISVVTDDLYSIAVNKLEEGTEYMVSFDFPSALWENILSHASLATRGQAERELTDARRNRKRYPLTITMKVPFTIGTVEARLGRLQECQGDRFIPLVIEEVRKDERNSAA